MCSQTLTQADHKSPPRNTKANLLPGPSSLLIKGRASKMNTVNAAAR
jgi:hypothetical protein